MVWPGLFASHQSVRTALRKLSGRRVSTRAGMTMGGVQSRFHIPRIVSVQFDVRVAHGLAPLAVLGLDELGELLRRAAERRAAVLFQLLRHLGALEGLVHLGVEAVDD